MKKNPGMVVSMAGVEWKNPIAVASGTFGAGREFSEMIDLNRLGAVTAKGVSLEPWKGNPPPRVAETYGGMLNSIGLQNMGVEKFITDDIPFLRRFDTKIIANVCGQNIDEYCAVTERLGTADIDLLELNISCPNVAAGGAAIGTDSRTTFETVRRCKAFAKQPLFVKLSPNVTDITEIAKAAEAAGADGISMINTLLGMKIDIKKRTPLLGNKMGGLSGPAIRPIAVRMVYQVYKSVSIPIIGMGGIFCADDAIEFMMAGANAVAAGMANLVNPYAAIEIIDGLSEYLSENGFNNVTEIIGIAH